MRRFGFVLLLVLAGGLGYLLLRPRPQAQEAAATPQVYTVARGTVRVAVSGSGRLEAWQTWEVRPEVQGVLRTVAQEGDRVQKGQVLAELDPEPFQRALAKAQEDLRRAQATLENTRVQGQNALASLRSSLVQAETAYQNALAGLKTAEENLKAARLLYEAGGISRQALAEAENAYESARRTLENARASLEAAREALRLREAQLKEDLRSQEAALAQARLALEEARSNLAKARVTAPVDGVVLSVAQNPGAQVGPTTPLLTLGDLSAFRLVLEVDETEIARVKEGLPVEVSLEGLPGETLRGRVEAISPQGEVVNNIPVFKVTVRLPPDERLRPGMSADGEIIVEEARDVLVVPKRAVERVRNRAYVTVLLPDGSTDTVRVTLGPEDATQVAVLEGLKEGDRVVLPQAPAPAPASRQQTAPTPFLFPGPGR
ncbi:efflux RND transporter periplasmic adaptor subunit [Thermus filiformis]|uniref:efflux RND transporter periplasmic adaptor subunit n=1 Tax=Thermus filiformis TaxID=276 RepID=UPI0005ED171F|nr:efflux RND transporter periplasmic adaptor subunit [Thermus filiformis]